MASSPLGELRFAYIVLSTERTPRRRRTPLWWRRTMEASVAVTFVFFLLM